MNEENILNEPAMPTTVTPPPFCPSEQQQEVQSQEPSASPTLEERIHALGLDESATGKLLKLTAGLDSRDFTTALLETLARGVNHDEDVQNADAAGYLRGRNEKIEAVLHQRPQDEEEPESTPVFPRYCRRSIWD